MLEKKSYSLFRFENRIKDELLFQASKKELHA